MFIKKKPRCFVIGDIHGCYEELQILINEISPTAQDTLIFLGDYIDRGLNSKAVLDLIIELKEKCTVIALLGNHEAMMRDSFLEQDADDRAQKVWAWYRNGGDVTLDSYMFDHSVLLDVGCVDDMFLPTSLEKHLEFINSLPTYHITDTHIFVHATPYPNQPIEDQFETSLIWRRHSGLDKKFNYCHQSGKTIISGHTAQKDGLPLILSEKNIIIDSGCVWSGWLTALDLSDGTYLQASINGVRIIEGRAPISETQG